MTRMRLKKLVGWLCTGLIAISASVFAADPNILMIVVDDMEGRAPGIFGGVFADDVTPNIDQLASEGMRFENAHVAVAVCQPSRQTIMTGKFPPNMGALGFTPIAEDATTLGQLLDQEGYINGTFHKLYHLMPLSQYEWTYKRNGAKCSNGRSVEKAREMAEEFIDDADAAGKPFFFMANTSDPHKPYYGTADEYADGDGEDPYKPLDEGGLGYSRPSKIYTEADVSLPAFLADSGDTLEEVTQYVNSCRRADDMVGELLAVLDEKGKRDNTIVIFLSDNGMPFTSAKFNTYFQSTKTPLIVRWPGHVEANKLNNTDYVSGTDLMPTILEAIGISIPADLDGSSIMPLLAGGRNLPGRDKVVTTHYEHVVYVKPTSPLYDLFLNQGFVKYDNSSLTRPKNMRCIQSDNYGYIFNAKDTGFSEFGLPMTLDAMAGLNEDDWWDYRLDYLDARGWEEFYDFAEDPDGLNNLIDDPAYAGLIADFRAEMLAWMNDIEDTERFEYNSLINGTPLFTYVSFANVSDGQYIKSGSKLLSEIEAEYIFADYPKFMILEVNGNLHKTLVRAPFRFDLSDLSNGEYELRLRVLDNSDDWTSSSPINITIGNTVPPVDTLPPTPNPLSWVSTTATETTISMTAETATDPSGVSYFFQWRKGTDAWTNSGWVTEPTVTAMDLASDSEYTLYVIARDGLSNMGSWSSAAKVTTAAVGGVDTEAPTVPTGLSLVSKTDSSITVKWNASSDNVGVDRYKLRYPAQDGHTDADIYTTDTEHTIPGLSADSLYRLKVKAIDAADNASAYTSYLDVTTDAAGGGGWVELNNETFNTGLGSWTAGGNDASYDSADKSLKLRDNSGDASAAWLTSNINLSGYSELKISFDSLATNLNLNKMLLVKISADGGSSWDTIATYTWNVDFVNGTLFPVELTTTDSSYFTSSVKIKLESVAGSNLKYLNIDNIVISAQ